MRITENEKKMIVNIAENNFGDGPVWSDSLHEGPYGEFVARTSFPGIVSSLVKKGLAGTWGTGRESQVALTNNGYGEYNKIRGFC